MAVLLTEAVTRLLAVGLNENKGESSHHHPQHIIISDTVLFDVAQETAFMDEVEDAPPTAAERTTRLFSLVAAALANPSVQVGFSSEGSARPLMLNTINGAQHTIRMSDTL